MNYLCRFLCLVFSVLLSAAVFAKTEDGLYFSHHDWEIACDNTGTCRMAGYHNESLGDNGISVLLTRKAGKGTLVEGRLKLAEYNDEDREISESTSLLSMSINNKKFGSISSDNGFIFSQKQTLAIVKSLSGDSRILFQDKENQWILSDKGGAAVILKMDEFQKRIGTKGALLKKGDLSEIQVLKAKPIPVIKKPKLPVDTNIEKRIDEKRKPEIVSSLTKVLSEDEREDYCPRLRENKNEKINHIYMYPLNQKYSLVSTSCWLGAYNGGSGFWLMNADLTEAYTLITESGVNYSDGIIYESHKSRGLGDCWSSSSRIWNGFEFKLAESYTTGMCKLIEAGGAWTLPTKVSKIE